MAIEFRKYVEFNSGSVNSGGGDGSGGGVAGFPAAGLPSGPDDLLYIVQSGAIYMIRVEDLINGGVFGNNILNFYNSLPPATLPLGSSDSLALLQDGALKKVDASDLGGGGGGPSTGEGFGNVVEVLDQAGTPGDVFGFSCAYRVVGTEYEAWVFFCIAVDFNSSTDPVLSGDMCLMPQPLTVYTESPMFLTTSTASESAIPFKFARLTIDTGSRIASVRADNSGEGPESEPAFSGKRVIFSGHYRAVII